MNSDSFMQIFRLLLKMFDMFIESLKRRRKKELVILLSNTVKRMNNMINRFLFMVIHLCQKYM